ncbi:hypothetical protein KY290_011048 [Solanum tuberosum]|uniref:Retrotransposon gag domain-containing protein n=1 Tax=Solanum tuberosum TaxID=4113 RepID=A0ABQ7W0S0_SOLTU|nr:hypothetical protein KY290_011048 [Solanum tuberosum]
MSSVASDPCDYDMGAYDCSDGGYGFEDDGDYGGYDDRHDQEPNGNESYYSGGEYEENGDHISYGEAGEDEEPCDGSYDDDGACEIYSSHSESEDGSYDDDRTCYTSHSKDQGKVRNQGRYGVCVRGLCPKRVNLPIFDGKCDPEAYLDWEWKCEQNFKNHDLDDIEKSMYALGHLKGLALSWWKHMGWLRELNGNANPLTWGELKWLMRFKYIPKGYTKLYNVYPKR